MIYLIGSIVVLAVLVFAGKWYNVWNKRRLERWYQEDMKMLNMELKSFTFGAGGQERKAR